MGEATRYPTLKDVARLANTSIATVSYILNDAKDRYISDELRTRVYEAAKELNYSKSALASALKGKNRGLIAVTVPQYSNIFFCRIVIAIEQVAIEHGYVLTICNTFDDAKREKEVLDIMLSQRADGFVFIPTEAGYENYEAIRRVRLPYVVVDRPLAQDSDYDFVSVDNRKAGRLVTRHLLDKGHRHIGYVRWQNSIPTLRDRLEGYSGALRDAGVPFRPDYVFQGEFSEKAGSLLTEAMLGEHPEITAIVFEEHFLALGGLARLYEKDIDVPGDVSVVLVGSPDWAKLNRPRITCVSMSEAEMGTKAAQVLFQKIGGTYRGDQPLHTMVDCMLEEGRSVRTL